MCQFTLRNFRSLAKVEKTVPPAPQVDPRAFNLLREGALFFWGALAGLLLLSLLSYDAGDPGWSTTGTNTRIQNTIGPTGALVADIFFYLFGRFAYLFPVLIGYRVVKVFRDNRMDVDTGAWNLFFLRLLGFVMVMSAGAALFYLHARGGVSLPQGPGGILGELVGNAGRSALGQTGANLVLIASFLFGITVFTDLSWLWLFDATGGLVIQGYEKTRRFVVDQLAVRQERKESGQAIQRRETAVKEEKKRRAKKKPLPIKTPTKAVESSERAQKERQAHLFSDPDARNELPPLALLEPAEDYTGQGFSTESLEAMSRLLELKLKDFGVIAEVVAVQPGPVVTRFEIQPAAGVKVSLSLIHI